MGLKNAKRKRRSGKKGIGHAARGLVMEGIGVAVLVFLYLTIQTSSSGEDSGQSTIMSPLESESRESKASSVQTTGHVANTWTEYQKKRNLQMGRQLTRRNGPQKMLSSFMWNSK